jgi:hypothetical protein
VMHVIEAERQAIAPLPSAATGTRRSPAEGRTRLDAEPIGVAEGTDSDTDGRRPRTGSRPRSG